MKTKIALKDFVDALELILRGEDLKSVTLFCSPLSDPKLRVRISKKNKTPNELVVTYGKPNYQEREFIKQCKKAKTHPKRVWFHFKPKKK